MGCPVLLWGPYGVPMESLELLWGLYGVPMGSLWGATAAVSSLEYLRLNSSSTNGLQKPQHSYVPPRPYGVSMGSLWGARCSYGDLTGSLWGAQCSYGVPMAALELLWGPYGVPMGSNGAQMGS